MAGVPENFYSHFINENKQENLSPTEAAKYIITKLPVKENPYSFNVIYCASGYHLAYGYIYADKKYGNMTIRKLAGDEYYISIMNGEIREISL